MKRMNIVAMCLLGLTAVWAADAPKPGAAGPASTTAPSIASPTTRGNTKQLDLGGGVTLELVWVPPGEFVMGSPANERYREKEEGTQHRVTISKGFWMGKYEVTQRQWEQVMPKHRYACAKAGLDAPVDTVNWEQATNFCSKVGARLPTEAEWEYACRAGTTTTFAFGDDITHDQVNYNGQFPYRDAPKAEYRHSSMKVGSFKPNAWGLYDMHGNAWEWCADWSGDYPTEAVTDPTGPATGTLRVIRGGGWNSHAWYSRSACRGRFDPAQGRYFLGFRVVIAP